MGADVNKSIKVDNKVQRAVVMHVCRQWEQTYYYYSILTIYSASGEK